jgi:DNA replicative helicase MCM subunit Mcm2 (Cdc46/Mcm family)
MMILVEKDSLYLEDEVKEAVRPETEDLDYLKLCRSIAPTVVGHEIVKECLLLQMASSDSRTFEDGTPHRGNLVLLFCGSPSSAKTVLARYVYKVHIRSVMPTGDGLTKPGLTAAVDTKVSPPKLTPGAYLMAKNGIVIIDEFQALAKDIRSAVLEVCEDAQTITITKAGIHRPLKADCASLHLCNPVGTAYWDDSKNIMENTGFLGNQLTRYDAVLVFRDIPNPETDEKVAAHWMKHYVNSTRDYEKPENVDVVVTRRRSLPTRGGLHSLPYMAMWLRHVRKTFHPTIVPGSEAFKVIQNYYLQARKTDARYFSQGLMEDDANSATSQKIPSITMRQLAALIRFAEASARAHHRNEVTAKDAEIACEIVRFSILNSGFNPVTKAATVMDANELMNKNGQPRIREMDILRMSQRTKDRFYREAARKFLKFEQIIKKVAIGKCLYCKGNGTIMNNEGGTENCQECNALGSKKIRFYMTDVQESLYQAGFTRADIEWVADVFINRGILERDEDGGYETVHDYDLTRGYKAIRMLDVDIEVAVDIDDNLKKIKEVADYLPDEAMEKINRSVEEMK